MNRVLVCGGAELRDAAEVGGAIGALARVFRMDCLAHIAPAATGALIGDWAAARDLPALACAWSPGAPAGPALDAAMPQVLVVFRGEEGFAEILAEARRREIALHVFCLDAWRLREAARRRLGLVPGETLLRSASGEVGVFVDVLEARDGCLPSVTANCVAAGGLRRNRPFRDGWEPIDAEGRSLWPAPAAERSSPEPAL